jgi:curved DNA-binding protein CbpA
VTTHYDVLGVSPLATGPEVKRAYYRRARRYHPDAHAGSSDAVLEETESAMANLNEAWNVLRDPARRAAYDAELEAEVRVERAARSGRRPGRHPRRQTPELVIGRGFHYWMGSAGYVTQGDGLRTRISLSVEGATDLAPLRSLAPDRLFALHAQGAAIGDRQLADLAPLAGLRFLDLSGTRVTDAGLVVLLGMESLEHLSLWDTQITDAGLSVVGRLRSLRFLGLGNTRISDAGLRSLSGLSGLRVLQLWGTRVSGPGLAHLKDMEHLELLSLPRRVRGQRRRSVKAGRPQLQLV